MYFRHAAWERYVPFEAYLIVAVMLAVVAILVWVASAIG